MTTDEREVILRKHLLQLKEELKDLDGQLFIILYDTKDQFISPLGYGCLGCLFQTLIDFCARIKDEPHTKNKESSTIH